MSEQDKRPVYMGTFERHRKETQVKHEDLLKRLVSTEKNLKVLAMVIIAQAVIEVLVMAMV